MENLNRFAFYLAVIGWLLSVTAHGLAIAHIDVADRVPYIWMLHVGIFLVWVPAVLSLRRNEAMIAYQKEGKKRPMAFLKALFGRTPLWISVLAGIGFYYAIANFILFATGEGSVGRIDGQLALHQHGKIIRLLSEAEYHRFKANELRGFSGHWIAFYGIAAAVLYPFATRGRADNNIPAPTFIA